MSTTLSDRPAKFSLTARIKQRPSIATGLDKLSSLPLPPRLDEMGDPYNAEARRRGFPYYSGRAWSEIDVAWRYLLEVSPLGALIGALVGAVSRVAVWFLPSQPWLWYIVVAGGVFGILAAGLGFLGRVFSILAAGLGFLDDGDSAEWSSPVIEWLKVSAFAVGLWLCLSGVPELSYMPYLTRRLAEKSVIPIMAATPILGVVLVGTVFTSVLHRTERWNASWYWVSRLWSNRPASRVSLLGALAGALVGPVSRAAVCFLPNWSWLWYIVVAGGVLGLLAAVFVAALPHRIRDLQAQDRLRAEKHFAGEDNGWMGGYDPLEKVEPAWWAIKWALALAAVGLWLCLSGGSGLGYRLRWYGQLVALFGRGFAWLAEQGWWLAEQGWAIVQREFRAIFQ